MQKHAKIAAKSPKRPQILLAKTIESAFLGLALLFAPSARASLAHSSLAASSLADSSRAGACLIDSSLFLFSCFCFT